MISITSFYAPFQSLEVHWNTLYDAFLEAAAGRQRWLLESQSEASRDEVKTAIYLRPSHRGQKLSSHGLQR